MRAAERAGMRVISKAELTAVGTAGYLAVMMGWMKVAKTASK